MQSVLTHGLCQTVTAIVCSESRVESMITSRFAPDIQAHNSNVFARHIAATIHHYLAIRPTDAVIRVRCRTKLVLNDVPRSVLLPVRIPQSRQQRIIHSIANPTIRLRQFRDVPQPNERPILGILTNPVSFKHWIRRIFRPLLQVVAHGQTDSAVVRKMLRPLLIAAPRIIQVPSTFNSMDSRIRRG